MVLLVLVVALVGLGVWVDSRLNRVDALADYEGRPAATPGADWLIVGSDSRQGLDEARRRELGTGQAAGRRADTMMLLHIPRGTGKPVLVSLPRDSYVPIPGRGRNKLNAAYAFGGPQLLARTVEQVTGIRLDRYMEVGFDGFASVVDAVGGVQICPDRAMRDPMAGLNVKAGCQVVGSKQALAYVRTRAGGRGDLDRVERQQEFLGSLIGKSTSPGVLLNPFRSVPLLLRGTEAVAVDQAAHVWNLIRFPFAMRAIANGGGVATTVPVAGTATISRRRLGRPVGPRTGPGPVRSPPARPAGRGPGRQGLAPTSGGVGVARLRPGQRRRVLAGVSVWWGGGEPAVGVAGEPPPALMHRPMMGPAHQRQVLKVGGAAMEPVAQMVGFAPGRGSVAAGHRAAAVADHQGGPLGGGDDPGGPADLQRLGRGTPKGRGKPGRRRSAAARQPAIATRVVVVGGGGG